MTRIVLVRHGQTEWNREDRFRGRADLELDDTGRAQAEACARRIAAEGRPSAVYSSPLRRAIQTAEAIGPGCGLAVQTHDGFVDLDYGEWQGLTVGEARRRWPELVEAWYRAPGRVRPPGGESLPSLQARALAAIRVLQGRHAEATVVVVAHDAVNRALLLAALEAGFGAYFRLGQSTGAINVIEADADDLRVAAVNDTCHLRWAPRRTDA